MKRDERIHCFTETIWNWFSHHKRELPWRDLSIKDDTERAFRIMVSEVMLQQTQVSRVISIYKRFLEEFPDVESLGKATNKEVILAWRGMGYNSRALRLRDAAIEIGARAGAGDWKYKGDVVSFPREMDDLMTIPGIGHYTAAAIRNFAFQIPTACLDTNIKRIYERVFFGTEDEVSDKDLLSIAQIVLEKALKCSNAGTCADWHAALMDFGSLVQTKNSPKWEICPLSQLGIMKITPRKFEKTRMQKPKKQKKEPGRYVGSKYIPNRIFRGKIIEELRDEASGLDLESIGQRVCIDWDPKKHTVWLEELIEKLTKDTLLKREGRSVLLQD